MKEVTPTVSKKMIKILATVVGVIILILILSSIFIGCERINTGHVGLKVNLTGGNKGISRTEYVTGWVFYSPIQQEVYEFPVFQQHIDYDSTQVVTKGGFQATIAPSFNYSLNAGSVADMYQNLKVDIKQVEQGWLKTAIIGSVNDVANFYTVDSIFNHRGAFENAILAECNKRVGKWFTVSQLRTNIMPPGALVDAINKKTQALQAVQVAENNKLVAIAEAEQKMAQARGDSASAVITAAGEANAIKLKQLSLTPEYIEYIRWSQWDGKLPTTLLGSGSNTLVNLK